MTARLGDPPLEIARRSKSFGGIVRVAAALLLGTTTVLHGRRFGVWEDWVDVRPLHTQPVFAVIVASALMLALLIGTTRLVAWLTSWEAGYRGLRLPLPTVLRALDYHSVHVLIPAFIGFAIVVGYSVLEARDPVLAADLGVNYLYTLAIAIIVGAFYLFKTYWTAMRNLMYANG